MRVATVSKARDLATRGVRGRRLAALQASGELTQVARGLYVTTDAPPTAHHSLVQAAVAVPRGVVCLLSALRFHSLGTQSPHEVWLAIDVKAWRPRVALPLHVVRFSGPALTFGVEVHRIEGVDIKVTSIAKTVADCFKYRHKIGVDVAVEALRAALHDRRATVDDILQAARVCRVANVIRPYLEALS